LKVNLDGFVKSRNFSNFVILAKAGIQGLRWFPVGTCPRMPLSGAGTTSGLRLEFIPYLMRGRSDSC